MYKIFSLYSLLIFSSVLARLVFFVMKIKCFCKDFCFFHFDVSKQMLILSICEGSHLGSYEFSQIIILEMSL